MPIHYQRGIHRLLIHFQRGMHGGLFIIYAILISKLIALYAARYAKAVGQYLILGSCDKYLIEYAAKFLCIGPIFAGYAGYFWAMTVSYVQYVAYIWGTRLISAGNSTYHPRYTCRG